MKIGRAALVVHRGKPGAAEVQADLEAFLGERGIEIVEEGVDLVISLGGDGTMLRAAQVAHREDAPLIGVNLGALGYLTEVDAGGARGALDEIVAGNLKEEERMVLECTTKDAEFVGLNEVLVERSSRHRLVRLSVRIGGERLASFNADGVLVATPTGSTAYALSAGGPIVAPDAHCLMLVPVSPHILFSRPFVLAPHEIVEITAEEPSSAYVSLDGAIGCEIPSGQTVAVKRHPRPLRLVRLSGPGFLERLRAKLDLPG